MDSPKSAIPQPNLASQGDARRHKATLGGNNPQDGVNRVNFGVAHG